jgi:general secretion pathway protein D
MSKAARRFGKGRGLTALTVVLLLTLTAPTLALAGKGKKHAKKGMEHEAAERWEEAAVEFTLAASDEPDNAEYRLHLARALTNASLTLTRQGDKLAEQRDYNQALMSYRKAHQYDRTNELAEAKMRKMRELLNLPEEPGRPETDLLKANYSSRLRAVTEIPKQNRVKTDVTFVRGTSLRTAINTLASTLGLNVVYDDQFKDRNDFEFEAKNMTQAKALELILLTNKLFYIQADTRSIIVAQDTPQNRTRYQAAVVRTFYLKNADLNDVRTLIQQVVQTKAIVPNKQLNALTVRDTPNNVELIEQLVASLDKDRAEVLVDVQVYEVNRSDLLSLGNQFKVDPTNDDPTSISFLGGLGAESLRATAPVGLFGPAGLAIAIPRSTLSALQTKTRARLLSSSQIHVLDGEQHTIRVGQRVPIRTAQFYTGTSVAVTGDGRTNAGGGVGGIGLGGSPATQFQYENVGLNIDVTPTVREDLVQLKMKIETSGIGGEGVGKNPIFTQRQLSSVASIRDGQSTLIAGVSSINKTESRSGLPLIGLIPILGQLFSIPEHKKDDVDVIILVTPHIMRAPVFQKEDHEAVPSGTVTNADRQISIEEIIYRAQVEEQEAANAPLARAPRQTTTDAVVNVQQPASTTRPVGARPSETIRTPGGPAAPPVVSPEESGKPRPVPMRPVGPQNPNPAVDEEELDEDEEAEEDPGPSAKAAESVPPDASPATASQLVDVRLAGLQTANTGKPVTVSLLGLGDHSLNAAKIAIKFDSGVLRVNKVESTGLFSGTLGTKLPYEIRGDVVIVDLTREGGAAPFKGQIASITFDVLKDGMATLAVVPDASSLVGSSGGLLGLRFEDPLQIRAR